MLRYQQCATVWQLRLSYSSNGMLPIKNFRRNSMKQRKRISLVAWGVTALLAGGVFMAADSMAVGIDAQPAAFDSRMVDGMSNFGEWMGEHAYAIAADGTKYAAYGGDHLYLAKKGPSDTEWMVETVDDTWRVGKYTSLALDSNGNPHISYTNHSDARDLKYARWNGSKWLIETVDGANSDVGKHNALALDSNNRPHIVYGYVRETDSWEHVSPRYAHWNGSAWQISDVDADAHMDTSDSYSPTSIAVDSTGTPHISYYQRAWWDGSSWYNLYDLKYATWDGTAWQTTTVHETTDSVANSEIAGRYNSIVVDSEDNPHIAYDYYWYRGYPYYQYKWELRHATHDGTSWSHEGVDQSTSTYDRPGRVPSIAMDADDNIHISYYSDYDDYALRYAFYNGSSWTISVASPDYTGSVDDASVRCSSIALDGSGHPHFLYRDSAYAQRIVAATWDGEWMWDTVDRSGSAAHRNDIALDNQGYTHVSYRVSTRDRFATTGYRYETSELRYGHWDGKEWQIETVVGAPDVSEVPEEFTHAEAESAAGIHNAIALDRQGNPHFSYFQRLRGYHEPTTTWYYENSLNHAWWDGSDWATEQLVVNNNSGDNYPFTSIAVDSKGYVHISYYDEDNGVPMYIRQDASGWLPEEQVGDYCDTKADDCGNWSDLTLDAMDRPHISYHNRYDGELIYAYFDGTDWQTTMVDDCYGNDYCGKSTAIILDGNNTPHISYRDGGWDDGDPNGNATVKYATKKGSSWVTETVAFMVGGGDTGIALSPGGVPHITYWDGFFKAPRRVTKTAIADGPPIWFSDFIDDARSMSAVEDGEQGPMMGKWNNIVMDPAGNPQFIYSDQTTQNVRHAGKLKMGGAFSWPMFVPAITGAGIR